MSIIILIKSINNFICNINVLLSVMRVSMCTTADKNRINSLAFHRYAVNVYTVLRIATSFPYIGRNSTTLKSVIIGE